MDAYKITGYIGTKNHVFMRAAAIGTWFGDFLTAWMVTDMMLQVMFSTNMHNEIFKKSIKVSSFNTCFII